MTTFAILVVMFTVYRFRIDRQLLAKSLKQAHNEERTLASLIRFLLIKYLKGAK